MSKKALLICEKPSQARNWAKALGGNTGIYSGQPYVIVAARGHIYGLSSPDGQVSSDLRDKYKSWDLENLPWDENDFAWKRVALKDAQNIISSIKSAAKTCDEVVYAGDLDPLGEGDLITQEIIEELKLDDGSRTFSRAYFSDEAPASLQKAFKQRKPIPVLAAHPAYMMADFRSKWDLLSMQWTRICTKLGDGQSLLRAGRLKSAMVLLVGQQIDAVNNYVRKPFYQNRFKDENGVTYTNPEEPTFDTAEEVPQDYHDSAVVCDSKTMKKTAPPKLIDLATLAARLAPKGIKAETVLKIYQAMYEYSGASGGGYVSYPRTEDKCVTAEQFNELLPKVDAICKVVGVDPAIVTHRKPRKTHVKDGMAHGANRPGPSVPDSLAALDSKFGKGAGMIYEILAKSYLAMLSEDYEYEQQKGHVADYPKFVGSANVPKSMGWKAVYDNDDDDADDDSAVGLGTTASPFVYEGANKKPQTPTMKWLVNLLAKYDIGTGATRTSTYSEITKTNSKYPLLVDKRGKISFAKCGEMEYLLLPDTHIGSLDLTKHVQEQMKAVSEGKIKAEDGLHEIQQFIIDDMAVMKRNALVMRERLGVSMVTPAATEYAEGEWKGKNIKFKRTWSGHRFTDDEVAKLLAGDKIVLCDLTSAKTGAKFGAEGELQVQDFKGRKFVGFKVTEMLAADGTKRDPGDYAEGTWKRKQVKFKRTWGGHRFTDEEVADLLAGKEVDIKGLVAKSGKTYGVRGKLSVQSYKGRKFVGFEKVAFLDAEGNAQAASSGSKASSADYAEGEWNGKHVRFKRVFRGKKLTDAQVKNLLAGKEITVKGLKSKAGKDYATKVRLANLEYNGKAYVGLESTGKA